MVIVLGLVSGAVKASSSPQDVLVWEHYEDVSEKVKRFDQTIAATEAELKQATIGFDAFRILYLKQLLENHKSKKAQLRDRK